MCPYPLVTTRATLHSAARGDLVVPWTKRRPGMRAFCATSNTLPTDIRTASTLANCKQHLKTYLFIQSLAIDTLLLGLSIKIYTDVILTHQTKLVDIITYRPNL